MQAADAAVGHVVVLARTEVELLDE